MERTVISRRIGQLTSDIDKLKSTLAAIEGTDIALYPENYNMLTTDAALRSELIACRMRHLIYYNGIDKQINPAFNLSEYRYKKGNLSYLCRYCSGYKN